MSHHGWCRPTVSASFSCLASNGSTSGTLLLGTRQNASDHMKNANFKCNSQIHEIDPPTCVFQKNYHSLLFKLPHFLPINIFIVTQFSFSTLIYLCILVLPLYRQFPIKGGFILIEEGRNTTCMLARHHFDGSLQVEDDLRFFLNCFHWLLSHWLELVNVHKHIAGCGTSSSFLIHLSMVRSKLSYQLIAHALDQMLGSLAHDQAIYITIAPKPTWRCQQGSRRARKPSGRRCRRWTHHES